MSGWLLVPGRCVCSRCGDLVGGPCWTYFERPGLWTIAYCEPCVELELEAAS